MAVKRAYEEEIVVFGGGIVKTMFHLNEARRANLIADKRMLKMEAILE